MADRRDLAIHLLQLHFHDRADLVRRQATVQRFSQDRGDPVGEQFLSQSLASGRHVAADGQPATAQRLEHAVGLELLVRASDCVWVDRKLLAERSYARQQLAGTQRLFGDRELNLTNNLLVDRDFASGVDRKEHAKLPCRFAGVLVY